MMKRIFLVLLVLAISGIYRSADAQLTPQEAAPLMQQGINLGNTLEPPFEGQWGNPPAQEYYFDMYKDAVFNCVRIPVRWDEHTQATSPYTIDASWLNRVEQIVDWGLARGLFIVINAHHEEWIKSNYGSADTLARFDSIWSQISVRFRNKSEKLFFEIINEPYGLTKAQNNDLHQRILSIIRKTNPTRIVIFQGHNWGGSDELIQAAIPADAYVMGSFHSYDPYLFGLEGQGTWGTAADYASLASKFTTVKNWSVAHNIPVFLGEFGSVKTADYNSRMKHYKAYMDLARANGFVACAWDDGGSFRIMEREAHKWNELKDILVNSSPNSPKNLLLSLFQDTVIKLTWNNAKTDYDSIFIERRTVSGEYSRVTALQGDSIRFYDSRLAQGKDYYYRVIAHYNTGVNLYSYPQKITLPFYVSKVRHPYLGITANIPGTVEAENFDVGGEGLTYHDMDPRNIAGAYRPTEGVDIYSVNGTGYHVGNALPGEWIEYTVNIAQEAAYFLDIYLTAVPEGGTFKIKIGNVETETLTTLPSVNWLTTTHVSTSMKLAAGVQIMRFSVLGDPWFNIDKFVFSLVTATASNDTISDNTPTNITVIASNNPAHQSRFTWTIEDNINISGESNSPVNGQVMGTSIVQTLHNLSSEPQLLTYTITPWTTDNLDSIKYAGISFNVDIWVKPVVIASAFNEFAPKNDLFTVYQGQNHELIVNFSTDQAIPWIRLYNAKGALVRSIQKPQQHQAITTLGMPAGLYIITTLNDPWKFSKKIILY